MNREHFKDLIADTLDELGLFSEHAVNLLMGTAAQESRIYYIQQLRGGPAKGYFQMEPNTYRDHVNWLTKYKPELAKKVLKISGIEDFNPNYLYNAVHAICMARIHYYRRPEALPTDLSGYAKYWKDHYNTYLGAGTVEEFIHNYKKYVL